MTKRCDECDFYKEVNKGHGKGNCRRYPPKADVSPKWPHVQPGDWCGEYKAKVDG